MGMELVYEEIVKYLDRRIWLMGGNCKKVRYASYDKKKVIAKLISIIIKNLQSINGGVSGGEKVYFKNINLLYATKSCMLTRVSIGFGKLTSTETKEYDFEKRHQKIFEHLNDILSNDFEYQIELSGNNYATEYYTIERVEID